MSGGTLESTGFITPDNQVVVIVMNTGDNDVTFKLHDIHYGMAVSIKAVSHSIQTFLY